MESFLTWPKWLFEVLEAIIFYLEQWLFEALETNIFLLELMTYFRIEWGGEAKDKDFLLS